MRKTILFQWFTIIFLITSANGFFLLTNTPSAGAETEDSFLETGYQNLNTAIHRAEALLNKNQPEDALQVLMDQFPPTTNDEDEEYLFYRTLNRVYTAIDQQKQTQETQELKTSAAPSLIQKRAPAVQQPSTRTNIEIPPAAVRPPRAKIQRPAVSRPARTLPQKSTSQLNRLLKDAEREYSRRRFDQALSLIQEYLSYNQQNPEAHEIAARIHNQQENYIHSIASLQKVLQLDPDYPSAHLHLGNLFGRLKEFRKSIFHLGEALKAEPDNPGIYYNLAVAYKETGNPRQAEKYLQAAHQLAEKQKDRAVLKKTRPLTR